MCTPGRVTVKRGDSIKKGLNYEYFDMSLEYLSLKHRIRLSP